MSNTKKFAECYPNDLQRMVPDIINEFQLFGGNSIANIVRRHGAPYREILEDVCDRLKVNYNKRLSTELLEAELLKKVAVTVVEKMTEDDIKKFDENLDKTRLLNAVMNDCGGMVLATIAILVSQFSRQVGSRALMLFGRILAPRLVAFAVPVLNVAAAAWTILDIASPAYRVTVPFTITTAFLRRQQNSVNNDLFNKLFS